MIDRKLYVIAVISNPVRYRSRDRLFEEFKTRMLANPAVELVIVEQAFGDRPFKHTDLHNRLHVQVRATEESEVWVKESLINIGFKHLTGQVPDWEYAAWIDADIEFRRANWAEETVEALQHFSIVQPWHTALDLGPNGEGLQISESFCATWYKDPNLMCSKHGYAGSLRKDGIQRAHPGYAWAIRRLAWEHITPLIDFNPMGSGDHQMAWAMVGQHAKSVDVRFDEEYKRRVKEFADRCDKYIFQNLGFVDGQILHYYHGSKRNRKYIERTKILLDTGFNVATDLKYNYQGLLVLTGKNLKLRDALKRYMRDRDEDDMSPPDGEMRH